MTGNDLKNRREAIGLTQQQLAQAWDSALSRISRLEQLEDEELPNSGLFDLALQALEAKTEEKKKPSSRRTATR